MVYSPNWPSHLEHVAKVLKLLLDHQLVAKRSKCQLGQTHIDYLGHMITPNGLAVDPTKIQVIQQWLPPTSTKVVRSFLGLASYYRRFIKNYATLASPLTDLLRKEAFKWTEHAQAAFETLKVCLSSTPVLALPNFNETFHVETDASGVGIGAILSQAIRLLSIAKNYVLVCKKPPLITVKCMLSLRQWPNGDNTFWVEDSPFTRTNNL